MNRVQIAVIGAGAATPDVETAAEEVGELLARAGCVVVCGGLGGVMTAVARGARRAGGLTIGILPGESRHDANDFIDVAVATGTGHARNLAVVASADAAIAVGGAWGTASEIALARVIGRPVVVVDGGPEVGGEGVRRTSSPREAVDLALSLV